MGRGRKGIIEQSRRREKPTSYRAERGGQLVYFAGQKGEIKKMPIPELALEFMKNMNPQQLADVLLNDDWHVKTSSGNASGN